MRNAFRDVLVEEARRNDKIVLLVGDIGFGVFEDFIKEFPDRYYNLGIAEANMIGVAAGLTMNGFIPVVYTIVPFLIMRAFEQIRVDLAIQNLKVVLVGVGGGLSYGALGPTHHSIEDLGLMRGLPNMSVFCPADPLDTKAAFYCALWGMDGPSYIRLGKNGEKALDINQSHRYVYGNFDDTCFDLLIVTTGVITEEVFACCKELAPNFSIGVYVVSQIKPFYATALPMMQEGAKAIAVVEEHTQETGLASQVAMHMALEGIHKRFLAYGIHDRVTDVYGSRQFLLKHHGLDRQSLARDLARRLMEQNH